MVLPISSARTVRLIFNDAVRGKSLLPDQVAAQPLEIRQPAVAREISSSKASVKLLALLQPYDQQQHFVAQLFAGHR